MREERNRDDRKRRRDDSPRKHSDRRRRDDTEKRDDGRKSSKSIKTESSSLTPKTEPKVEPAPQRSKEVITEELKNKEILYQAKMAIQERMRQMKMPTNSVQPSSIKSSIALKPEEASAFVDYQMDKVNRLNELKNRLPSAAKNLPQVNIAKTPAVVLDSIAVEKHQKVKHESTPFSKADSDIVEYLDPREYEKQANVQRSKAKLEKLQSEISRAAKQTGISSAVKLAIVTPSGTECMDSYIPKIEWWDEIVLGNGKSYDDMPSLEQNPQSRYVEAITELVEHPIQLKPPDEPMQPQYLRACLTKKERKKLRRQNRREVLKEKMEKVRLGLEKPPEPKLKISNLMRVLGNDAVQDPTKMEAHVRKQIAERLHKHTADNEERKLTREQKAAKMIRKVGEDTSLAVHVAVFKVKSLANASKKFKVHMNAKQLQMTGIILILEDINVIVVEGGPKQQKFYKNLVLNRIKWADEIAGQRKEKNKPKEEVGERNECALIWEGIVQKRAFGEPRFVAANNHKHAREILDKHGVPHYWDLCYSTSVLLNSDE
ncbi:pre-mRNA processing factor 3 (PRP3) domain-containing protein [Ditylenchus destructor]|nr:pre-mRNA processing factor 3 (PRP3) domain-containing protein [Ditylenchus destructor]